MKPDDAIAPIVFLLGFAALTAFAESVAYVVTKAMCRRAGLVTRDVEKAMWRLLIGIGIFVPLSLPLSLAFAKLSSSAGPIGMGLILFASAPALWGMGCIWLIVRNLARFGMHSAAKHNRSKKIFKP